MPAFVCVQVSQFGAALIKSVCVRAERPFAILHLRAHTGMHTRIIISAYVRVADGPRRLR